MDKNNKPKKAWYKRVWVWIGIIVLLGIIGSLGASKDQGTTTDSQNNQTPTTNTETPTQKEPAEWDIEAAYAKISEGMTKAEVEKATGKKSENCTESDMGDLGKMEICAYGNAFTDKGAISVTYDNDGMVSSKTKSTY